MEENESIQNMFCRFQVIINELFFLGKILENYNLIKNRKSST